MKTVVITIILVLITLTGLCGDYIRFEDDEYEYLSYKLDGELLLVVNREQIINLSEDDFNLYVELHMAYYYLALAEANHFFLVDIHVDRAELCRDIAKRLGDIINPGKE